MPELILLTVTESMPRNIQACADNTNTGKTACGIMSGYQFKGTSIRHLQ
jgi:hypothetical protein